MFTNKELIHSETFENHFAISSNMFEHYPSLLLWLVVAVVIAATVLLYFAIHLARLRSMNAGTKVGWIVFMVLFGAFAFPVFYYLELRKEPNEIDVYPDIA